jgi:hypothetical protein
VDVPFFITNVCDEKCAAGFLCSLDNEVRLCKEEFDASASASCLRCIVSATSSKTCFGSDTSRLPPSETINAYLRHSLHPVARFAGDRILPFNTNSNDLPLDLNMASLYNLPNELIRWICDNLSRADIFSLRLVSKQFPAKTMDHYLAFCKEMSVGCNPDGLYRLQTLALLPEELLVIKEKVKHVAIHVLTLDSLQDIANTLPDNLVDTVEGYTEDKYLNAYIATRAILLNGLKELPKLERITIVNFEPNMPEFDPRIENINGVDPLRARGSRLRGWECALSIMPHLKNQNLILHHSVLYSAEQYANDGHQSEPFNLYKESDTSDLYAGPYRKLEDWEELERKRRLSDLKTAMFGHPAFSAGEIVTKYTNRITLTHYARESSDYGHEFMRHVRQAPITHVTLVDAQLSSTMNFFGSDYGFPSNDASVSGIVPGLRETSRMGGSAREEHEHEELGVAWVWDDGAGFQRVDNGVGERAAGSGQCGEGEAVGL